eukprot:3908917-Amphidinium_carterae.1
MPCFVAFAGLGTNPVSAPVRRCPEGDGPRDLPGIISAPTFGDLPGFGAYNGPTCPNNVWFTVVSGSNRPS